jgi:GntR family transcriptional regulator
MTVMSGTPAYVQVAADLRAQIERGELSAGAQLPSNAQLRGIYSVSNTVVRDAINELRRAGLVVGQQGKGVFVRSEPGEGARTAPAEDLERRLAALEGQIAEPSPEVQSLRREVAILRTYIIDLYARMGYPYPREMAEEPASEDTNPKLRRGGESNASQSA